MNELGKLIKTRRLTLGLSQGALASNLGVDQTFVSKLENGTKNYPMRNAGTLAGALGVRTIDIVLAILGEKSTDPRAVEEALEEVDARTRGTLVLKPKGKSGLTKQRVIQVPIFVEISAAGTKLSSDKAAGPIDSIDVSSTLVEGNTSIALKIKDDSFRPPLRRGTKLLAVSRQCYVGDEAVIETKERKLYLGILKNLENTNVALELYDLQSSVLNLDADKIWVIYRVEAWQRQSD